MLLPGLVLVLGASSQTLHLQIGRSVNSFLLAVLHPSGRAVLSQTPSFPLPLHPICSLCVVCNSEHLFPGRFVYTGLNRDSSGVESSRGKQTRGLIQHPASLRHALTRQSGEQTRNVTLCSHLHSAYQIIL